MLKLFKEKGNADLSLLKIAIIADVTKYFRYDSHYSVEALKIFVESNMITEEDITRFDEAAKMRSALSASITINISRFITQVSTENLPIAIQRSLASKSSKSNLVSKNF